MTAVQDICLLCFLSTLGPFTEIEAKINLTKKKSKNVAILEALKVAHRTAIFEVGRHFSPIGPSGW